MNILSFYLSSINLNAYYPKPQHAYLNIKVLNVLAFLPQLLRKLLSAEQSKSGMALLVKRPIEEYIHEHDARVLTNKPASFREELIILNRIVFGLKRASCGYNLTLNGASNDFE